LKFAILGIKMIAKIIKNTPKLLSDEGKFEYLMFALGYRKQPDGSYISPGGATMHQRDAITQVTDMVQSELSEVRTKLCQLRNEERILHLRLVAKK